MVNIGQESHRTWRRPHAKPSFDDGIRELFARREQDFARRDWRALAADYADECVVDSPTAGILRDRVAIESVYRKWFAAFPDFALTTDELLIVGDRVVQTWSAFGTDTGGFVGLPPTGKAFRFPGVFVYEMRGGRIIHERGFLDFSEGARLYRDTLERVRQEHELRAAAEIQHALLPAPRYDRATYQVAAASIPCRAIGGDFFDFFDLSDDAFGFVLADVAGKGPPAALLKARLQGIFAVHAYLGGTPAQTLDRVNGSFVRRPIESRFATTLYGVLWPDGRFRYCNAGHNHPILVGTELRRLGTGGPIIGMFDEATFDDEMLQLAPGDTLVAFSDGITEALNVEGDEFGEERLLACVERCGKLEAAAVLQCVLDTLRDFSVGSAQHDDVTLLVLRYTGG
jgi:predicted ester cyclase